jgi:hypothetical protein
MAAPDRSDLPTPRIPNGSEAAPVLDFIARAIAKAPAGLKNVNSKAFFFKVDEDDWYNVLAYALAVIIATRDAGKEEPSLLTKIEGYATVAERIFDAHPHDGQTAADVWLERDLDLAYADHYLQMRADAFVMGPDSKVMLMNAVLNYDLLKLRGLAPRTGSGAVSPATDVSVFWGMQGIADGLEDRKHHTVKPHKASVRTEIEQFVEQATVLGLQDVFRRD